MYKYIFNVFNIGINQQCLNKIILDGNRISYPPFGKRLAPDPS